MSTTIFMSTSGRKNCQKGTKDPIVASKDTRFITVKPLQFLSWMKMMEQATKQRMTVHACGSTALRTSRTWKMEVVAITPRLTTSMKPSTPANLTAVTLPFMRPATEVKNLHAKSKKTKKRRRKSELLLRMRRGWPL